MESTFILILMSAGVLVAILGAILFTSERELKAKRRQIEELLAKLESLPQGGAMTAALPNQDESSAELAELRSQNRDLQNQLQALSGKLELSEKTIDELQATGEKNSADPAETARLQVTNDQLEVQLAQLRDRLAASEAEIQSTAGRSQDGQETYARLQAEVAELKQQLGVRQEKISALEAAQQNIPDVGAIEARHRQERQTFQERIAELEQRMLADQQVVSESQTLRQRLVEAEESQKSLRDEMQRHEEEIPRWQARIAEGEEHRQRLAALRAPFDELLSKEAALAEQQRQLQEELSAFARMMATPVEMAQTMSAPPEATSNRHRDSDPPEHGATTNQVASVGFADLAEGDAENQPALKLSASPAAAHEPTAAGGEPDVRRGRSYGIFGLLVLLAASGAAAFHLFGSSSVLTPPATATANDAKPAVQLIPKPDPSNALEPEPAVAEAAPDSESPPVKQALTKSSVDSRSETAPRARQTAKIEPRVAGTFQITRPGRVYTAPSEASRPIGDIEPGVKVDVVDAHDGWLEIHSKHGRPPGFIRREFAARVSGQN
jgi:predicted  nucleic acid-binding Zn-ribbon protein